MSTTTVVTPDHLLTESAAFLHAQNSDYIIVGFTSTTTENPYSPPVWQKAPSMDKVPMNPRKHYRGWK